MLNTLTAATIVLLSQVSGAGADRYPNNYETDQPAFSSAEEPFEEAAGTAAVLARAGAPGMGETADVYQGSQEIEIAKPLPKKSVARTSIKPSQLLKSLADRPSTSKLVGEPITLAEALQVAGSREHQSRVIQLYWSLSKKVLEYDLALRELTELGAVQGNILQPAAAWGIARQEAQTTVLSKLHAARATQYQLQSELGRSDADSLLLPRDLPYSGEYRTRYDEIFANRDVPEAEQLNELLSVEYASLYRHVESVADSKEWFELVSTQRSSQSDGTELLRAYESFARSRRIFLQAVNDYNNHISRYTELVAPQHLETNRLVAMLIKTKGLQWERDSIQRASAEENIEQNSSGGSARWSYDKRAELHRKPVTNDREHSILVD